MFYFYYYFVLTVTFSQLEEVFRPLMIVPWGHRITIPSKAQSVAVIDTYRFTFSTYVYNMITSIKVEKVLLKMCYY